MILKKNIQLVEGRRLVPTPLGIALIKAYRELNVELIEPTVRANVECKLSKIACGEADFATVRDQILSFYREKYFEFTNKWNKVEHFFRGIYI